jgi:hypothetical protein
MCCLVMAAKHVLTETISSLLLYNRHDNIRRIVLGGDEKGSIKSKTVKYGHGLQGTQT